MFNPALRQALVDVDTVDAAVYAADDDFMPIHAETCAVATVVRRLALRIHAFTFVKPILVKA